MLFRSTRRLHTLQLVVLKEIDKNEAYRRLVQKCRHCEMSPECHPKGRKADREMWKDIITYRLLVLACLVHQYSEIRNSISCPPALSESSPFICNFRFGLHSDPFKYDPKEDLACVGDKSNCSVICTLFKIVFLGKWDERGERPFLRPLTSFPDRHTYSVHSVQYRLSCFEQFCWDLIRTCGFATCCLTDGTSNL